MVGVGNVKVGVGTAGITESLLPSLYTGPGAYNNI